MPQQQQHPTTQLLLPVLLPLVHKQQQQGTAS
jgi:hypothetical protein